MSARLVVYAGPEAGADWVASELGAGFEVRWVEPTPQAMAEALAGAQVFLDASMKVRVDAAMLQKAVHLRLVVTATTGADHIDRAALEARSIPLWTLQTEREVLRNLTPAAEHSWLLLMACARKLRAANRHVEAGGWDRSQFPGLMLRGRALGLVGCGRIGSWMARYAQAFGMSVSAHDPLAANLPADVRAVSLEEIFETSDVVSIHVPYTTETETLISEALLEKSRAGLILINTSRGQIVDEAAAVRALVSGRLGALGTDVLATEPEVQNSPLWHHAQRHDNVIITPHIGGFSLDAVEVVVRHSSRRILAYFGGQA